MTFVFWFYVLNLFVLRILLLIYEKVIVFMVLNNMSFLIQFKKNAPLLIFYRERLSNFENLWQKFNRNADIVLFSLLPFKVTFQKSWFYLLQ